MNIIPFRDRVIARPRESELETASGIILKSEVKEGSEKQSEGTIVAVGKGHKQKDGSFIPLVVAVDDKIIFSKFAGNAFTDDGIEYVILKEADILSVIVED